MQSERSTSSAYSSASIEWASIALTAAAQWFWLCFQIPFPLACSLVVFLSRSCLCASMLFCSQDSKKSLLVLDRSNYRVDDSLHIRVSSSLLHHFPSVRCQNWYSATKAADDSGCHHAGNWHYHRRTLCSLCCAARVHSNNSPT